MCAKITRGKLCTAACSSTANKVGTEEAQIIADLLERPIGEMSVIIPNILYYLLTFPIYRQWKNFVK